MVMHPVDDQADDIRITDTGFFHFPCPDFQPFHVAEYLIFPETGKNSQCLRNMPAGIELGVKDVTDNTCLVNYISNPAWQETKKAIWNREHFSDPFVRITEQYKRKKIAFLKIKMRLWVVAANANNLGACLNEIVIVVTKGTGLPCATRRVVPGVKKDYQVPFANNIRKIKDISELVRQPEYRNIIPCFHRDKGRQSDIKKKGCQIPTAIFLQLPGL
jgi:hypothetical protein